MNFRGVFFFLIFMLTSGLLFAQSSTFDDVHLFQNFLKDAPVDTIPYGEGGFQWASYEYASSFGFGVQGGYPINPQIEIGAALGFVSVSPDKGDGVNGISDLMVTGRYKIANLLPKKSILSAGGYLTLPIGSEDIGASKFNLGFFGSLRHPINNEIVITGILGLDFLETKTYKIEGTTLKEDTEYETSFLIGAGSIYRMNRELALIGELNIMTEGDYILLTGGADYKLQMGSKVRGAIGIGLDDGAPDFTIMASFLHAF